MPDERYVFTVTSDDKAIAGHSATALADVLREAEGVLEAERGKPAGASTMDLGTVVTVVATSGATLAIAKGIAAWLRARRGVILEVERDAISGSMKAAVSGIDPETAMRIVEKIREG